MDRDYRRETDQNIAEIKKEFSNLRDGQTELKVATEVMKNSMDNIEDLIKRQRDRYVTKDEFNPIKETVKDFEGRIIKFGWKVFYAVLVSVLASLGVKFL